MFNYEFNKIQEILWGALIAATVVGGNIAVEWDPDQITDWRAWTVTGLVAIVRAFVVAIGMGIVRVFGGKSNK